MVYREGYTRPLYDILFALTPRDATNLLGVHVYLFYFTNIIIAKSESKDAGVMQSLSTLKYNTPLLYNDATAVFEWE